MIIREETASTKWQVWRYQNTNEDFDSFRIVIWVSGNDWKWQF